MTIQIETIRTPRLVICPFNDRHLNERYVQWLNDKEVVSFSEQRHRHHTFESCAVYWQQIRNSSTLFWAIESRDPELGHLGNISVSFDYANSVADVAILLGEKKIWGRGFGKEAFGAVCEFLLRHESIRKISAGTMACNHGMRGVMRQVGMKDDGYRKRHYELDGEEVDAVFGALYRAEN